MQIFPRSINCAVVNSMQCPVYTHRAITAERASGSGWLLPQHARLVFRWMLSVHPPRTHIGLQPYLLVPILPSSGVCQVLWSLLVLQIKKNSVSEWFYFTFLLQVEYVDTSVQIFSFELFLFLTDFQGIFNEYIRKISQLSELSGKYSPSLPVTIWLYDRIFKMQALSFFACISKFNVFLQCF